MLNRFTTAQSTVKMRRWRPAAIATLAAMAALTVLTAGASARQARPATPIEATAPRAAGEPIMAIVSIKTQQVTFYDADGWILRAPVSTGISGRETPAGVFAVIEKDKDHHSTLYDDAWMPNMQRITWNGVALHGGPLPGYAASHGCVRMPFGFAEKLFDKTWIGMRVIISPNDAAPVEFSHPALFVPNKEAIAAAPARAETLSREAEDAGFESVWVMDHFFQLPPLGGPDQPMLEAYTLLGALAARTKRVQLGTLVTGVTYRNPGILAKMVTTLDIISRGRAILGIGGAWYDVEHLPGLAAVQGTVRASRFRNPRGSPRYHACYDIESPSTVGSPPWVAVRGTSWSQRVRPAFRNTKRTMFRRITP